MYQKGKRKGSVKFGIKPAVSVKTVMLAGDFTSWNPIEMKKQKDGSYAIDVSASPGVYEYKFLVDDQWVTDPDHDDRTPNRFGTQNSVAGLA